MTSGPNAGNLRIAVFLSGRGSNFQAIYHSLAASKVPGTICRVISDKPDAPGLAFAGTHGIPSTVVPRDVKNQSLEAFHQQLTDSAAAENPGLIVLAGFMRLLPPGFVAQFRGRIINIHPSLLPAFRGLNAQAQALQAGVKLSGCTAHYVTEDLDGGPIIAQAAVPVLARDTVETLSQRILEQEHQLYPAVVAGIVRGEIRLVDGSRVEVKGRAAGDGVSLRSL